MPTTQISPDATLVDTNIDLLRQALRLLGGISDREYSEPHPLTAPQRVGPQMRHILEFYECFLNGAAQGTIDYDARRRDASVEHSRQAARERIGSLIERLSHIREDAALRVRMEDAPEGMEDAFLASSVARELQVLASHTTHHFALIAMILQLHGYRVEPDFGVARSTLRYRRDACAQ